MAEILRDPIWQSVGAILALIAIGISIYLYILQKSRKSLSYKIPTETELLTIDEMIRGKIQITYEGERVHNVYLIILKVINDGNVPIAKSDFDEKLTISFGEYSKMLSPEVIHVLPENLKPEIVFGNNKVVIEPLLMNSKDEFDIKFLCSLYKKQIDLDGRIVGVGEIKKIQERDSFLFVNSLKFIAYSLIGWFSANAYINYKASGFSLYNLMNMTMLTFFFFLILVYLFLYERKKL